MATLKFNTGGTTSQVPVLDSNNLLPSEYMPKTNRIWRTQSRTHGTWYTNNSGGEMVVMQRIAWGSGAGRHARIGIRENSTSTELTFQGVSLESAINYWSDITVVVPAGWQYRHNAQSTTSYSAQYEFY